MADTTVTHKQKEVNVTLKMNLIRKVFDFLREVKVELQKVVWPTRQETIQLTLVVIIVTLVVGFFLGGIDLGLTQFVNFLLNK